MNYVEKSEWAWRRKRWGKLRCDCTMSEAVFQLAYDGDALRDGEMDIGDLAPALLGLGQLVEAAGRIASGDDTRVTIKVKAHREGRFEILLSLAVDGGSALWAFAKSDTGQAADTLLGLLGITGIGSVVGVVQLVKWLGGRKPDKIERRNATEVAVTIDNVTIVVDPAVFQMAYDPGVRSGLERVVAVPLDRQGIDEVRFGSKARGERIRSEDRHAFRVPLSEDGDTFESRYVRPFSIEKLSFKPGQKWRLSDGHSPRSVLVSDEDFVRRVDRSEIRFAKGDVLICDVIERSIRATNGFRSEYEIVKVLEHRPAPSQPRLEDI
eukprot:Opistho-1_new@60867